MAISDAQREAVAKAETGKILILEAWAQGFMVGALLIMAAITVANMRRGVLLHKLILIELIFGMPHGTFIFPDPPVYGWYLSVTAIFLNISWVMHNIIAWMKNKPFLSRKVSLFYIITVLLTIPYWILEIYANFTYFNNINNLFHTTRPYEALFRDPWWIFTTCNLFYNIIKKYDFSLLQVIKISPRFGVLLAAMVISVIFIITDICSVTGAFNSSGAEGVNPFWKFAFVFKCLTDTIILDDFKTALDRLKQYKLQRLGSAAYSHDGSDDRDVRPARTVESPYNESKGTTDLEKGDSKKEESHQAEQSRRSWNPLNRVRSPQSQRSQRSQRDHRDHPMEERKDSQGSEQGNKLSQEFPHLDMEMAYWTKTLGSNDEHETHTNGESSRSNG